MKKGIFKLSLFLIILYLILLIPDSKPPILQPGDRNPFAWNQDEYWSQLEKAFLNARNAENQLVLDLINSKIENIEILLDSCKKLEVDVSSPLLLEIETIIFELSPLIAAKTDYLSKLIELHNQIRIVVKELSRKWDIKSAATRDRLYRLLYGTRTAVEEVMLQADTNEVQALSMAIAENSVTPSAEIMGVTIHSGDILVSRGGAPTSALIARGNDYPGNFSHVALVYIDQKSNKISIIESHIEVGVVISTVDEYIQDTKLRILVLRLRANLPALLSDPLLPHKAAIIAYERAQKEHIPYDFEMNFHDDSKLFCSEVASFAYTRLGINLWMGISQISSLGVRSWLAAFGIKYFETEEPSDLEYDPQLRVVAEWRDPILLYKDHLDNAIIDVMLEGAEAGERLQYDWYMLPIARIFKGYSIIKNIWDAAGPIPEGMSATSALKNEYFSKRHAKIKSYLIPLIENFYQENKYRPPYWELVKLARQAKNNCVN